MNYSGYSTFGNVVAALGACGDDGVRSGLIETGYRRPGNALIWAEAVSHIASEPLIRVDLFGSGFPARQSRECDRKHQCGLDHGHLFELFVRVPLP